MQPAAARTTPSTNQPAFARRICWHERATPPPVVDPLTEQGHEGDGASDGAAPVYLSGYWPRYVPKLQRLPSGSRTVKPREP